jgi:hypothetical protein
LILIILSIFFILPNMENNILNVKHLHSFIISNVSEDPCGSMSYIVGFPNNTYKPITNTAWVRALFCKL